MAAVQLVFPCQVASFPCRYLGAPPTTLSEEQRLVDAVAARIPTWKAGLLNNADRLTLTKSTVSAIPVHILLPLSLGN